MPSPFTHLWDLDPETTYLNHGSFGPSPIQVRAVREDWSAKLERQPMRFFLEQMEGFLDQATVALSKFVRTNGSRLALVDNATTAMNIVAETIDLQSGDEVILTDHEYGAVRKIWQDKCRRTEARLVTAALPFPLNDEDTVRACENAITDRTKVIVISHITSPTAAILPVKQVCELARQRGIVTAIDGPHAVAMLDLHLDKIGCDFYCASCHKWLCAPFGSGFLWADPKHHNQIRCPIVSWGGSMSGQNARWQDRINWLGTRDPAPLLTIPAAIEFLSNQGLSTFREHAHALASYARRRLLEIEGIGPLCTTDERHFVSMCAVELPQPRSWKPGYQGHPDPLQLELRRDHGIETPVGSWGGRRFLRVSAHLYNSKDQMDRLAEAVNGSEQLR